MKHLKKLTIVLAIAVVLTLGASTAALVQERNKLDAENQQLQSKLAQEATEKEALAASLTNLNSHKQEMERHIADVGKQIAEHNAALGELRKEFETAAKMLSQNVIDGPALWAQTHGSVARVVVPGGIGSAFVGPNNLIITAQHVVDGKDFIAVKFPDGTATEARVCAENEKNDLAILKPVNPITQKALPLAGTFEIGQPVLLIGNQAAKFLSSESARRGIINALYQEVEGKIVTLPSRESPNARILYDASTNPGDSGGPLLNAQGQVVGVASSWIPPFENTNLAIASTTIQETMALCLHT